MIGKESTEDVLCGHLELIGELGAVPATGCMTVSRRPRRADAAR
jgi:hypothetical protein